MKRLPLILTLFCGMLLMKKSALPQQADTTAKTEPTAITDRLEDISSGLDFSPDYTDLTDDYYFYHDHPLNLNNQQDIDKLIELDLINPLQANNLRVYLLKSGKLQTVYELKYIDGFDAATIKKILPFVTAQPVKKSAKPDFKHAFTKGKNMLIARFEQPLQQSAGYRLPPDSAPAHPGSVYLGNSQKYYLRYGFDYNKKIRFGFTAEKDAGEVFLKSSLPDTVLNIAGDKITPGFDFYSGYVYLSGTGPVKKLVAGDYHLEFAQGLTLWSGLAFGFSSEATGIKKYGRGLRPNSSVNENRFFRGAAIQLGWKKLDFTAFYSHNRADATVNILQDTLSQYEISGMQETGNHRTLNELSHKNTLSVTALGGRVQYKGNRFTAGGTLYQTLFNPPLIPDSVPYRYFAFRGNKLLTYGADANILAGKWELFGEFSGNISGGKAVLAGVNGFLTDRFSVTLYYRNIGKAYHNFFNYPAAESNNPAGEQGIYMGANLLLSKRFTLSAYTDYFHYSWLRYRADAPSVSGGRASLIQLNFFPLPSLQMYLRFRHKQKEENDDDKYSYLRKLNDVKRSEWRWNMQWQLTENIILKSRIEYVNYRKKYERQQGYLVYQDVLYRPEDVPVQVSLRLAYFDTDGWESRIYAYENDLLYLFTIPAYYDRGQRGYLMLKWHASRHLNLWFRYGQTHFYYKNSLGTGNDEIQGNNRSDIKIQLIWKF